MPRGSMSDVPLAEAHKQLDLGRLFMATGNFQRAYLFVERALMQLYQVLYHGVAYELMYNIYIGGACL